MLVSIIIPVYNSEKYLEKCLRSIVAQTYKDIEIICVLDGSDDKSSYIASEFQRSDNRVIVIENEMNYGIVRSRKVGVEAANGSLVCFVDSDDWVGENFISEIVDNFTDEVDCVVFGYNEVREDRISTVAPVYVGDVLVGDFLSENRILCYSEDFSFFGLTTFLWNKGFRKEKFESVMYRVDDRISIGEDFLYLLHYLETSGKIRIVDASHYYYVQHSASMVKSRSLGTVDRLDVLYSEVKKFNLRIFNLPSVQRFLDSVYIIRMYRPCGLLSQKFNVLLDILHNGSFILIGVGTFRNHVESYVDENNLGVDYVNVYTAIHVICYIDGTQRILEEQKCRLEGYKFWSIITHA